MRSVSKRTKSWLVGAALVASTVTVGCASGVDGVDGIGDSADSLKGGTPGSGKTKDKTNKGRPAQAGSGAVVDPRIDAAGSAAPTTTKGKGKGKVKKDKSQKNGGGKAADSGDEIDETGQVDADEQADEGADADDEAYEN